MREDLWTVDQIKLALHLYCQLSYGQLDGRRSDVIELAQLIGRTPGAVARKMQNLANLDPRVRESGRKGLANNGERDKQVWGRFTVAADEVLQEAEALLARLRQEKGRPFLEKTQDELQEGQDFSAEERLVLRRQRHRQQFFRRAVLVSYDSCCCITQIAEPKLLVASHIVPWRANKTNRLNPVNGLCLSSLCDRAFDQGLLTLDADYRVVLSDTLRKHPDLKTRQAFAGFDGMQIQLPNRFLPDPALLQWHRDNLFVGR